MYVCVCNFRETDGGEKGEASAWLLIRASEQGDTSQRVSAHRALTKKYVRESERTKERA